MEIRREHNISDQGTEGPAGAAGSDEALRWTRISGEIEDIRKKFGAGALGDRRTELGVAPAAVDFDFERLRRA